MTADLDLIGSPLTPLETRLLAVYDEVRAILREEDLASGTRANLLAAVAPLGVAVTGLGLRFEHLIDDGA